ncbi:MAG: tetratricopeptide repeat protein [Acidobacteriota bacterium]|nr:tetratricopeptide repeat protein [Acidobacteriota bacterium]
MLQHALEIAIRSWLLLDKEVSRDRLEALKFPDLVQHVKNAHPELDSATVSNLKQLCQKRNRLIHDPLGAAVAKGEYPEFRESCIVCFELIFETKALPQSASVPPNVTIAVRTATDNEQHRYNLLREASTLYYEGRTSEARTTAESLLAADPDNGSALQLLGLCLRKEDEDERALKAYEKAAQSPGGKTDVRLHLEIAETLLALGRADEAIEEAKHVVALGPTGTARAKAFVLLGDSAMSKWLFSDAERHYREALAVNDTHQRHVRGLVQALMKLGRFGEAHSIADAAVRREPRNAKYYLDRAEAAWYRNAEGDIREAARDFSHAKELNPRDGKIYITVAELLRKQAHESTDGLRRGELLSKAAKQLAEGVELTRRSFRPALRNLRSCVFLELGDSRAAVAESRCAVRENPRYVTNRLYLARALIFAREYGAAHIAASDALVIAPAPPGRFWCSYFQLLTQLLKGDCASFKQQFAVLEAAATSIQLRMSFDFGPMWNVVARERVTPATADALAAMARLVGIDLPPLAQAASN